MGYTQEKAKAVEGAERGLAAALPGGSKSLWQGSDSIQVRYTSTLPG